MATPTTFVTAGIGRAALRELDRVLTDCPGPGETGA